MLLLCVAPWLWLRRHAPHADPFWHYPFGDGRGLEYAVSITSWLRCRWLNLWYSLVPGVWLLGSPMHAWLDGPLPGVTRWAIQAAKTLPAGLGFSTFPILVLSLLRRPSTAAARFGGGFLLFGLALALLYWGFSDDGLGRNCLEPLTLGTLLWACHRWPLSDRRGRALLVLLVLETLSIIGSGLDWHGVRFPDPLFLALLPPLLLLPLAPLFRRTSAAPPSE